MHYRYPDYAGMIAKTERVAASAPVGCFIGLPVAILSAARGGGGSRDPLGRNMGVSRADMIYKFLGSAPARLCVRANSRLECPAAPAGAWGGAGPPDSSSRRCRASRKLLRLFAGRRLRPEALSPSRLFLEATHLKTSRAVAAALRVEPAGVEAQAVSTGTARRNG